jgi:hypothetical protein
MVFYSSIEFEAELFCLLAPAALKLAHRDKELNCIEINIFSHLTAILPLPLNRKRDKLPQ